MNPSAIEISPGRTNQGSTREPSTATWHYHDLESPLQLSAQHLTDVASGYRAAIRIPGLISPAICDQLIENIYELGMSSYPGMDKPLGRLYPSHWDSKYVGVPWDTYFSDTDSLDNEKVRVFAPLGASPFELLNELLSPALGQKIERLYCPDTGRRYHAFIVRSGAAALHYDSGRFDLPENLASQVEYQYAINLYLQNPGHGGELEVYRRLGDTPGMTSEVAADLGTTTVGNYDLPMEMVHGIPKATIPVLKGDFLMIMNQFIHRVAEVRPAHFTSQRLAVSAHIAKFMDGSFRIYN